MNTFEDINDHLVYNKTKSKTEALSMKDQAKEISQGGKSVVVFFNKRYHLYLAPGHDPYQIRKDIDIFLNPPKDEPKNTPIRDSSGKFISKKQSIQKPDSSTSTAPPKKKGFWSSLK